MATYFPVVQTTSSGSNASNTSHTVTLPSGIVAQDRLLVFFVSSGSTDTNTPSGWTKLGSTAHSGSSIRLTVYSKTAVGGDTLTITTTGSSTSGYSCYRIVTKGNLEISTFAQNTSTAPNSDSLTPAAGSQKYLWWTAIAHNTGGIVNAFPASYTLGQITDVTFGTRVASAYRSLEASSENPGAYTLSTSLAWVAVTVSVQEQTDIIATPELATSTSSLFTLDSDFAGDATFDLLVMPTQFLDVTATASNRTRWSNETKPSTSWVNDQL